VRVTAVTLAAEQRTYVTDQVAKAGLGDLVEVRLQDCREITDGPFDAIATIEMGEHVGAGNYSTFASRLYGLLRPQGRLLVQQMSRRDGRPGGGDFIEAYIAPDMHMRPVGDTVALLEAAGLEYATSTRWASTYAYGARVAGHAGAPLVGRRRPG
jgi:cyclopropane-fatty-acyl-phospholipid synthase